MLMRLMTGGQLWLKGLDLTFKKSWLHPWIDYITDFKWDVPANTAQG